MVELEFINQFRDYKLYPIWPQKCTCGSTLNLHMTNGTVNKICTNNYCRKQYEVPRCCTKCNAMYTFDDIVCDVCEPVVIKIADLHMTIINSDKAIKKLNRSYKAGRINEKDWKSGIRLYKDDKERCEKQL